jgi:hypothetical protein
MGLGSADRVNLSAGPEKVGGVFQTGSSLTY